jgi:CHAT domain-containing protein
VALHGRRSIAAVLALLLTTTASAWFIHRSRLADDALAGLVASMPQQYGRLAIAASPALSSPNPGFDPHRLETWPLEALRAAQVSVDLKGSAVLSSVRLKAAIDLYRGDCNAAAAGLEEALRISASHVLLLNDASVAHLCLSREPDLAGPSLARAMERALEASELSPGRPEPEFNLAVAYEALGLRSMARDTFLTGMAHDHDGGWRQIAAGRAEVLSSAATAAAPLQADDFQRAIDPRRVAVLVADRAQPTREVIELKVLEQWAQSARNKTVAAAVLAENLRLFGDKRLDAFGDAFLHDVAAAVNGARGRAQDVLIRAQIAYARGRDLYDRGDREQAGDAFAAARKDFNSAGSAFELEASLQQGLVLYQLRQLSTARTELDGVRREAVKRGYRAIDARATWLLGLIDTQEGRVENAVAKYERAIATYDSLHEQDNLTSVANSAADTLRTAGDRQRGWRLLMRAAQGLPSLKNPQREYLIIFNLSLYAQDEGLLRAADVFQRAAVRAAEARGASLTIIESQLRHAQLALKRDDTTVARHDLEDASPRLGSLRSAASAAYLGMWKERVEADLLERENPRAAMARLEALAEQFEKTEPAEIPSILLEASRASRRAGDNSNAVRLLHRALDFMADRRTLLRAPEYRITYRAAMWEVLHDLIGLEFSTDPAAALTVAEAARRALMTEDVDSRGAAPPVVLPRLPEDVAVLYYVSLQDRLLLWTITAKGTMARAIPYAFDELAADVDAFRRTIESWRDAPPRSDLAQRIFDRLFSRTIDDLEPSVRRLLIAADGAIGDLPVSTLVDPRTRRFIFERYDLAFIPSLGALTSGERPGSMDNVLAVGFNGVPGSDIPLLNAAEKEAEAIASLYGHRTLLLGSAATASAVRSAAANRSVVHIAAHARANRLLPWKSQLSLAPANGSGGSLDFEEIAAWDLRGCVLVVLSACETATGARLRGQGVISLAFPFLSAGAEVVVGTLWQVDDSGADQFMRLFHGHVARREPPMRAMSLAQRDAQASRDTVLRSPTVWGAFVVNTRISDTRSRDVLAGQSIPGGVRLGGKGNNEDGIETSRRAAR